MEDCSVAFEDWKAVIKDFSLDNYFMFKKNIF